MPADAPLSTTSRSMARNVTKGGPAIGRRAWRKRVSSGASSSTAPNPGISRSRRMRLANAVRSEVMPWRTTAIRRPSGSSSAASIGLALNHWKPSG